MCRRVLKILKEKQIPFEAADYFSRPLTKIKLKELLCKLNLPAKDVLRKNEPVFKKLNLAKKELSDDQFVDLLIAYPDLIQRPIVERDKKVILARPAERILEILK